MADVAGRADPAVHPVDAMISVRVARILERELAICLDRPFGEPWLLAVEDARRLHRDLGEALGALCDGQQEEAG